MGFATTAIHAGQEPDSAAGAVSIPIYQTSTYAQEGLGKHKGFEYARTGNPTRLALERNLAALEGAKFGYAFASGMAAIDATLRLVKAGDHVIVSDNTYGGTNRLFKQVLANYGIEFELQKIVIIVFPLHCFHANKNSLNYQFQSHACLPRNYQLGYWPVTILKCQCG